MMKRILPLAVTAAALLIGGTAQAQQRTQTPLYGELGYSWLDVRGDGLRTHPQALRGIIGYEFHPYLAAEGMLAFGTSSSSDQGVNTKLRDAYGVFIKPKYDIDKFEVFGRLGWAHTRTRTNAVGVNFNDSVSDLAWGAGANYNFNPRMYASVDYMRYADRHSTRVDGWTVGLGYRF